MSSRRDTHSLQEGPDATQIPRQQARLLAAYVNQFTLRVVDYYSVVTGCSLPP